MNFKKHLLEASTLIVASVILALISNAMAARERKVQLVGNYPNALTVPTRSTEPPAPIVVTNTTATTDTTGTIVAAPVPTTTTTTTTAPIPTPITPAPATATTSTAAAVVPKPAVAATPAEDVLARFAPHPDKAYVEIGGDDVARLYSKGVLFLDARRTSIYEQGHIAGARSFSVWESDVDDKVNALFEERNDPRAQAQPIVIYCSGGDCEDSHMLAQKLWGVQFNNVYVYKDGFPDWQKRGGAAKVGSTP